ncbi:hypothetical protein N9P17_01535 [Tateyamaria sp.]|nr:hypothetical protein [Tateyamaria sp.]
MTLIKKRGDAHPVADEMFRFLNSFEQLDFRKLTTVDANPTPITMQTEKQEAVQSSI